MSANILQQVYQFPVFTQQELAHIYNAHEPVVFKKGDLLLKEGKTANEFYFVEEGLLRSFVYDYNGKDITVDFFVPGNVVIEPLSFFQRKPTREHIEVLCDCKCVKINFDNFQHLYHQIKNYNEWGRAWFADQLFQAKQRSIDMISLSATDRYKKLMHEKPQIIQQAPLKTIATYLGITDSSLSRIRKELFS